MAIPTARIRINRPEVVSGTTYRIRPSVIDEAIFITINDLEVDGHVRPVEIFVNSKHAPMGQWISALTRLLSAQLQQPGDFPFFIIDELKETVDPLGGYFIPGKQKMCPSIVAHLGLVLEEHCAGLGIKREEKRKASS